MTVYKRDLDCLKRPVRPVYLMIDAGLKQVGKCLPSSAKKCVGETRSYSQKQINQSITEKTIRVAHNGFLIIGLVFTHI
jgi:hypothetical protein